MSTYAAASQVDASAEVGATPFARISTVAVVEMLLKDQARLNALLRSEVHQQELIPKLMAIAVVGFAAFGLVLTAILNALAARSGFWLPHLPAAHWNDASALNLTLGYTIGLIAANGICLPSFYFYGLLTGVRITMLGITAHALKGMAAGAVALVGLLPVYVALALSAVVFPLGDAATIPWITLGLALPFIAGIVGALDLYHGFVGLADTMRDAAQATRTCFLRRLILAWVTCASFVTPVVIYALWDLLSDLT